MDQFSSHADTVSAPSSAPFSITPSDSAGLLPTPKAIYVGSGGTIVLRGHKATADVTFKNVPSGFVLDVRASHVRATGTTATDLVALA